ncbi:MAG: OmpA family protein [Verrucomicrobiales bacterium]|nr:OmpA family protein [Verrucomicrobiales bacterium]
MKGSIFGFLFILSFIPAIHAQSDLGSLPPLRILPAQGTEKNIIRARREVEEYRSQLAETNLKLRKIASHTLILREKLEAAEKKLAVLNQPGNPPSELPFELPDVVIETSLKPTAKATAGIAPIIFPPKSAVNYPERDRVLREVLALVKKNPAIRITITGYADEFKFEQTNLDVSQNRAGYLASWLRNNGVPREVIVSATGVGSKSPASTLPNRRVEFSIK